ncbi:MAG: phosphoenolpyruvate hydrolase family protein [Actinomycetota bacterium]|nr:phosphoenolpyruvate hydrolase family protein [Actinomycetota bacterium]
MARRYTRSEVRQLLQKQIKGNKAIFMFGAGIGLSAKCAEIGGADLIGIYSTAFYRMMGTSSLMAWLPYSNANDELIKYSRPILPVVKETPLYCWYWSP